MKTNCTSISEKEIKNFERRYSYFNFVDAFDNIFDNIDVRKLSDELLQRFCDICDNGLIEAHEELRRRGL